ncbi:MAG: hypothetical protein ACO1OB_27595 [Archangium sp.]
MTHSLCLTLSLVAFSAVAAPTYTVNVRVVEKGKSSLVPLGTVELDGNELRATPTPAPSLEKLAPALVAKWKAFKRPATIDYAETLSLDTGMKPAKKRFSFTFTPKDKLYPFVVLRSFLEKNGYESLGLDHLKYIEFDRSAEEPEGARDRASHMSNHRKGSGDDLDFNDGKKTVWVYAKVRPTGTIGHRTSASDATVQLARRHDEGRFEVGHFTVFEDGRIELEPITPATVFEKRIPKTLPADISFSVVGENGVWQTLQLAKDSPTRFEAWLLEELESRSLYEVTPLIDPAKVR